MAKPQNSHSEKIGTSIKVRLIPRSSKNHIIGRESDAYKVKVTSPPVGGKANKALIELLAKSLGRPKRSIEITSGKSSRLKTVLIRGLSMKEIRERMERE